MKKLISILLIISVVISAFVIPVSAESTSVKTINKTLRQYTNLAFYFHEKGYDENARYYIKTEHKEYLKAKFSDNGYGDEGIGDYYLAVSALKVTAKVKPVVTVYCKDENGKVSILRRYIFTIKKAQKVKVKNIKVNKGEIKRIPIPVYSKHGYEDYYNKDIVYSYSKKGIAKADNDFQVSKELYSIYRSEDCGVFVKGLKYGKTKVTAKLKGTNFKLASFYVTVKYLRTSIKKKYKTVKLEYNPKGEVYKQECLLDAVLSNMHSGSKYYVKIKNTKIAKSSEHYSWSQCIQGYLGTYIRAKKLGKTTVTVYEKRGSSVSKVGSFKLKVKKAKLAEICDYLVTVSDEVDSDTIKLSYDKTFNLKKCVKGVFLYNIKNSSYTITFKAKEPEYISVSKDGKVKCLTKDRVNTYVTFTIKFKDGSKFKSSSEFYLNDK